MKQAYWEIIEGQVISNRPIAVRTKKTPADVIGVNESTLVSWVNALEAYGTDKAKARHEMELSIIGRVITELIDNGYRIMGTRNGRIRIAVETFAEGTEVKKQFPDTNDLEVINRLEVSKKGIDGLGKLMGSRRNAVEWVDRIVMNIRAKMEPKSVTPF